MRGFLSGRFILVWRYCEVNCFSLNRHVSDKDKQSKLYRNVQPVFSIDDEDDEGGTLLHVYSSYLSYVLRDGWETKLIDWLEFVNSQQRTMVLYMLLNSPKTFGGLCIKALIYPPLYEF